jgi:hypothetical protein
MALSAESNPMRWPAGPLDIALQDKTKGFTTDKAAVLRNWLDPATLGILQHTLVNTLVVSWASGLAADSEQQQVLTPLIEKGRETGVGFVGVIDGEANIPVAIAAARSAGLIAVAMEGEAPADTGIPVIQRNADARIRWGGKSSVMSLSNGIWPGIPQDVNQAGGPTNLPWVDSNGATLRIARALAPEKEVWIEFNPPQPTATQTAEAYMLAVADPASYGARWVVSLDDGLRADLSAKKQPAMDSWKKVCAMLAFFQEHKQSKSYQPMGRLALVSNFAGDDWDHGEETLNLLPRLREPSRVFARSRAATASFEGLEAIYYTDQEPPDAALRAKLLAFARGGGILFVPSKWSNPEGPPIAAEAYLLFNLHTLGKGRLAVCKEEQPDPYDLTADLQTIMSHRYDPIRLYNASSMNFFYETSAQGKQGVIHLLNYSRRPASDGPLFYVKEPHRTARLVSPELASPTELHWAPQEAGGSELSLPKISVYGAVELES